MATKKLAPVGLVLRGLRASAGITQRAHAGAAGIPPAYLSKMETGLKKVPYGRIGKLISALGVGHQAATQARLAIFHGDGLLSESEMACLIAHHACWPVICLYKSHATFGKALERCGECGAQIACRPAGHECQNGCGSSTLRKTSSLTEVPEACPSPEEVAW